MEYIPTAGKKQKKEKKNGFKDVGTGHVNKLTYVVSAQYLLQSIVNMEALGFLMHSLLSANA